MEVVRRFLPYEYALQEGARNAMEPWWRHERSPLHYPHKGQIMKQTVELPSSWDGAHLQSQAVPTMHSVCLTMFHNPISDELESPCVLTPGVVTICVLVGMKVRCWNQQLKPNMFISTGSIPCRTVSSHWHMYGKHQWVVFTNFVQYNIFIKLTHELVESNRDCNSGRHILWHCTSSLWCQWHAANVDTRLDMVI